MTNAKISALTGATTPLAGTETLPVVQGGATKQVSVANLTLGRAVNTAGGTFTNNLVQGTAAKGINFTANTPAAGMTSQLLNWYEEGTFTPTFIPTTGAFTSIAYLNTSAAYTRIGRLVTVSGRISTSGIIILGTASGQLKIGGLPFSATSSSVPVGNIWTDPNTATYNSPLALPNKVVVLGTELGMYKAGTVNDAAFVVTTDLRIVGGNSNRFSFTATYFI